jgi:3-hydroxyisobutyrate dehydrogenase-like beta-hydroxyacid dehydrogenase
MRVGFIGLGHIGADMAKSLAASPFELTVFDVVPGALSRFEGIARAVASAAGLSFPIYLKTSRGSKRRGGILSD